MMRYASLACALALAACGPSYAPANAPADPCPIIDAAAFQAARDNGAAHARADVKADGSVWLQAGPGIVHCASYNSAMKPCRRPNDFVIEYHSPDKSVLYVRVPANAEYRFNVHKAPNTCEIVRPLTP